MATLNLAAALSEQCSEYCAWQGIAPSEGAANFQLAAELLQHHLTDDAKAAYDVSFIPG